MSTLGSVRFYEPLNNVQDCPRLGKMDVIHRKVSVFAFVCCHVRGG